MEYIEKKEKHWVVDKVVLQSLTIQEMKNSLKETMVTRLGIVSSKDGNESTFEVELENMTFLALTNCSHDTFLSGFMSGLNENHQSLDEFHMVNSFFYKS
jgi:hypothetical protein